MGSLVDRQLASREMTFDQLNDSPEVLNALEEEMIEPLCRTLRQSSCSGAFSKVLRLFSRFMVMSS